MTPNATQARAEKLLDLYAEAEALLLQKIANHLKIGRTADAPLWVQKKLRETDALRREFQSALDQLEKASAEERIALMWAAHDEGADGLRRELRLPEAQAARSQAVVTLIDDIEGRFSELHRRILRDAQDVYRDVLSQALPMAAMGVETARQAMQRALNGFADRGITGFVDKAGRHWGIAEYAEMATRTGMMNAALAGYAQEALNHGEDLVIISDHYDECPLCAPWERKVLSLTGAQQHHPDCQGVLADARAAGLFHPNCLHSMTVYVPGLTRVEGGKTGIRTAEEDAQGYANRQQQRYMERTVRKWKRRQAVALTPEEERYAKAYVDRWQARLRSLTGKGAKLPRKYDREGGRILLGEAAKKLRPFTFSANGAIIKPNDPSTTIIAGKTFSTKMRAQKQQQHIWGSKEFIRRTDQAREKNIPLPSAFNESVDIESLVRTHMVKGTIDVNKQSVVSEYFCADENVGQVYMTQSNTYMPTTRVCIRYSKEGWHAFPVKEVTKK